MRRTLPVEKVAAAIRHAPYSRETREAFALEISLRIFPEWSDDEAEWLNLCKREGESPRSR